MSFAAGSFAVGSNGNHSIVGLGFQPAFLKFTMGDKFGTPNGATRFSAGATDGTNQWNLWTYGDSTGSRTVGVNSRCCGIADRISGSIADKCDGTFVSFDTDGFTLNFTNADSNYDIFFEAYA